MSVISTWVLKLSRTTFCPSCFSIATESAVTVTISPSSISTKVSVWSKTAKASEQITLKPSPKPINKGLLFLAT